MVFTFKGTLADLRTVVVYRSALAELGVLSYLEHVCFEHTIRTPSVQGSVRGAAHGECKQDFSNAYMIVVRSAVAPQCGGRSDEAVIYR
eukprot:1205683-Prymnesium_polylepis.4